MLLIPEAHWFLKSSEVMAGYPDVAVLSFQVVSEVRRHCFQHVFGLQIHSEMGSHFLDFYLKYFPNSFGLYYLDASVLMRCFVTGVSGVKVFFPHGIQTY
jgi:hypothetical protein